VRRWFNCLLIGVLTCSLLVDTAKACWYRRHAHAHAARGYSRPACPPVATWPACHDVVVSDSACGSGLACSSVVIVDGWRDDVCCGGDSGIVVESTIVQGGHDVVGEVVVGEVVVDTAESVTAAESVVAPSEPTIAAEPAAAQAEPIVAPQNGIAAVAPAVPELKPAVDSPPAVEPVVALEPAPVEPATEPAPQEPAPEPAPEPAAPQPEPVATVESPVQPAEPNIFEEVESAADAAILAPAGAEPLAEPSAPSTDRSADNLFGEPEAATEPAAAPVADPPAEPSAAEPALDPKADASEPAAEPVAEPAADDAPATEEPASQPAAAEADPFSDASREPLRRWVDDTGSYATVGMLVDVRAEGVEIRKANGRTVIVPLDRLSEHDRAYAADAEARLAADRAPSSRETVGL
jgi:hypothetical protein